MRFLVPILLIACFAACDGNSPVAPSRQIPDVPAGARAFSVGNTTVDFGPGGAPRSFSVTSHNTLPESLEGWRFDPEGIALPGASIRYDTAAAPGFDAVAGSSLRFQYVLGVLDRNGTRTAWDAAWSADVDAGTVSLHGGFAESGSIEFIATQLFIALVLLPQLDGTLDVEVDLESVEGRFTADNVRVTLDTVNYDLGPLVADTQQSLSRVVEDVESSRVGVTFENPGLTGGVVGFEFRQAEGGFFYRLAQEAFVIDAGMANEGVTSWDRGMFNDTHPGQELGADEFAFLLGGEHNYLYGRASGPGAFNTVPRPPDRLTFESRITGYVPGSPYGSGSSLQQAQVFQAIVAGGDWGLSIANYDNAQQAFGPDVVVETGNITDVSTKAGDPASGVIVYVDNTADAIRFVERNAQNEYATVPGKTITNAAWPGASGTVVSAVQKADGSILFVTDGAPGELWSLAAGAATATKISEVGDAPRRVRCAGNIAAVSLFGGFGGLGFFFNAAGGWERAPFSLAAQRSIGIDAKVLPSGNVAIASADFFNDELRITTLDNTDGTILDDQSLALPAGCLGPGHAAWMRDDDVDHRVLVSCNGSGNVAVVPTEPE